MAEAAKLEEGAQLIKATSSLDPLAQVVTVLGVVALAAFALWIWKTKRPGGAAKPRLTDDTTRLLTNVDAQALYGHVAEQVGEVKTAVDKIEGQVHATQLSVVKIEGYVEHMKNVVDYVLDTPRSGRR